MRMFERLTKRVEAGVRAKVERLADVAVEALREVPGIGVTRTGGTVTIEGRGLAKRWLRDARLRFALRSR